MGLPELLQHLFPAICPLCGMAHAAPGNTLICADCATDWLAPATRRCLQCALPIGDPLATHCGACLGSPPEFDATLALGDYAAPLDRLVILLKFQSVLPLAGEFAARLAALHTARSLEDAQFPPPDLVIPIPLAPRRLAERGFNQSWEIARQLGRRLGVNARHDLVQRLRETAPQATLAPSERRRNIRGAFAMSGDVHGLHVAVVDDVMTTGVTLGEIAGLLKRHGARRVSNCVVLRTPPD